jgi:phage regulator Rha-like protein
MAIHPVPLNANWYSHRQKLTISFKNCLSETRFYSIILLVSLNFQKLLHVHVNFIIPLFFTLKTSTYCDKGKKDQYKNHESNIQQYTHSKPNKQNRVHVLCKVVLIEWYKLSKNVVRVVLKKWSDFSSKIGPSCLQNLLRVVFTKWSELT